MKFFLRNIEALGAILLAIIWVSPLLYAFWAAFHNTSDAVNFNIYGEWTLDNFKIAWDGAPWLRYFLNTFMLVTVILIGQFFVTTLAGFAFAQIKFPGRDFVFILVLMQLFILPEVLIVENYAMVSRLGLFDTILGVGMPYMASAFGIFLMRQAFKGVPYELHEAARVEGCGWVGILWRLNFWCSRTRGRYQYNFSCDNDVNRTITYCIFNIPKTVCSGIFAHRN